MEAGGIPRGLSRSQHNQSPASEKPAFREDIINRLLTLVPADKKNTARNLITELLNSATEVKATLGDLRKAVAEEVKIALADTQKNQLPQKTWASIAAGTPPLASVPDYPKKVIPTRLGREILIRGDGIPASLSKRTPQEIIQAVNQATSQEGAIAARKLPSGDTIVTFRDADTRSRHSRSNQWIQAAFGEQAKEAKRTFAVLIKGLRRRDL